jgi:hypothetical protein
MGRFGDYIKRKAYELSGAWDEIAGLKGEVEKLEGKNAEIARLWKEHVQTDGDRLALALLGRYSVLTKEGALRDLGVNEGLVRVAQSDRSSLESAESEIAKLKQKLADSVISNVCESEGLSRVPALVYGTDGHVYCNDRFRNSVRSTFELERAIGENIAVGNLNPGSRDRYEMSFENRHLVFLPDKNPDFVFGYMMPKAKGKNEGRLASFERRGMRAASDIYRVIKSELRFA